MGFTHSCQTWEDRHVRPWGNPPAAWDIPLIWSIWGKKKEKNTHNHIYHLITGEKKVSAVNKKIYWDYTQSRLLLLSRGRTHHLNDIPDILVLKHQKPGVISGVILPPSGHTRSLPSLIQMRKSLSVLKSPPDSVIKLQTLSIYAL